MIFTCKERKKNTFSLICLLMSIVNNESMFFLLVELLSFFLSSLESLININVIKVSDFFCLFSSSYALIIHYDIFFLFRLIEVWRKGGKKKSTVKSIYKRNNTATSIKLNIHNMVMEVCESSKPANRKKKRKNENKIKCGQHDEAEKREREIDR